MPLAASNSMPLSARRVRHARRCEGARDGVNHDVETFDCRETQMGGRDRTFIEQSRALIAASRKRIDQARRRVLFVIRGGSTALAELVSPATPAAIPRVFAGPASGNTRCSACGMTIPKGAPEYEVVLSSKTMVLHRVCFVAWENRRHPTR